MIDISNPKAVAFFGSLFAALLSATAPGWVFLVAIALVVVVEFAWYCVIAYLFALKPVADSIAG